VTTDYPAIAVQAGDTVSVDLEILAPSQQETTLAVSGSPTGWTTSLRGGGFIVGGVTASPIEPPQVELEIAVPADASPGDYTLEILGTSETQTDLLNLTVAVADSPVGGISLETDFASLRGRPDDTFLFDLQVTNQRPEELTLAFDAVGPEGWNVTAGPASEERASAVTVAAGASESVSVEANPTPTTPAGEYPIEVTASGGGQSGSFTLTAVVTGQATIQLTTADERLDLSGTAGNATEASLLVTNSGTADLEGFRLSADPPTDWTVEFEPAELAVVAAGTTEEVLVRVQPSADAVAGDYVIGVTGSSESETSDLVYRFTVDTSRWWGVFGVIVIAAAIGALFYVFRRYGRR
jgi:uncharacterized membrane protein